MAEQEDRDLLHDLRKAERGEAMGLVDTKKPGRVSIIENRRDTRNLGRLSKQEKALLRSMALTVEDNPWQRIQFTNKFNSLAPTYDPTALAVISYQNNTLRQCIGSMVSNIDGTGYDIKRRDGGVIAKVVSADSPDPLPDPVAPQGTPNAPTGDNQNPVVAKAPLPPPKPILPPPEPKEKPVVGEAFPAAESAKPIMVDPPAVAKLKAFWDEPYPGISFKTMRKKLRDDLETTGNAYLEVIRDQKGNIALLNPMDSKLTRMIRHDDTPVAVTHSVNRSGIPGEEQDVTILVHERRYVQIIGLNARFFKAYKATRNLNAQTGIWQNNTQEQIPPQDNATEVIHFIADRDVLTPYGIPRWINQLPSVMGSRKAEELNLEFFEHGGVPPVMILIQGGTLSASARQGLTDYLAGKAKFKQRGVVVEVAPSGGDLNSAGQVKVTTEKFGDMGDKDSKFEKYDERCTIRVRGAFRLPAVLIGLEESYNYATVQTAVMMAEEQVFNPERIHFDEIINSTIMMELDPDKVFKFESKRMSAKFLDEQIKALAIVAPVVEGQSLVDTVNSIAGMDLKFDQKAADQKAAMGQPMMNGMSPMSNEGANMAGTGGGSAEGSTGAGGGSQGAGSFGKGGGGSSGFGVSKSSTGMDGNISIDPANPARLEVRVTRSGAIRKLDSTLLTDLAIDWAHMMTGEVTFTKPQVDTMYALIKSMTPALRQLFAENVAQKVVVSSHDPNGMRELVSCAGDVLARLSKAA